MNAKYAYIKITTNDEYIIVPAETNKLSLDDYYREINTDCIDIQPTTVDDLYMIIDDEGKLKEKPMNITASLFFPSDIDYIVGDVLIGQRGIEDIYALEYEEAVELMEIMKKARKEFDDWYA